MLRRISAIFTVSLLCGVRSRGQTLKERVEKELVPFEHFVGTEREGEKATLAERMENWFVPGISVDVINNYQVEWSDGYGFAQEGVPATADTIYQAGTISSLVTSLATLKYVENGTLDLERNINDYLTSWKIGYQGTQDDRVKLKHLLSHSGAVEVEEFEGYAQGAPIPTLLQTLNGEEPANNVKVELIEDVLGLAGRPFPPGTQEDYSSGGFAALQQLLQDVTRIPYDIIVQDLVLDKAGMSSSSFTFRDYRDTTGVAFGHQCNTSEETTLPGNWNQFPESAAQGMWSNVADLAKLVINIAKGKDGDPDSILSADSTSNMLTLQLPAVEDARFGLGTEVGDGKDSSKWFYNTGYSEGYCSEIIGNTDGRGLVMMSNLDCSRGHFLLGELFRSVAGVYGWDDAEKANVEFNTRLPAKLPLSSPQPWEGTYQVNPVNIPIVGPIELPFTTIYVSAGSFQADKELCRVDFYPCANKDNTYCPVMSILQDITDRLGEVTFTAEEGGGYRGQLYLINVPFIGTIRVTFQRIAPATVDPSITQDPNVSTTTIAPVSTTTRESGSSSRSMVTSNLMIILTLCYLMRIVLE